MLGLRALWANSRDVAAFFGKDHKNVLRDIGGVLKSEQAPSGWFVERQDVNPQNGQPYPSFDMTCQGFTLLVMGYTGAKAMGFKIDENLMRAELTPAQVADHLARRKAIWAKRHEADDENSGKTFPETPRVSARGRVNEGRPSEFAADTAAQIGRTKRGDALGGASCTTQKAAAHKDRPQNQQQFAADTAEKTGVAKSTITRATARAKAGGVLKSEQTLVPPDDP